jgi:hypothetical protein
MQTVHTRKLLPSFAGAIHDFSKPLKERAKARKHCGPYQWTPTEPGGGRGFYQSSKGLYCDRSGSTFDLRLEGANDHLDSYSRLARINGYYCDEHGDQTLEPIVARLPHGRGFLAGWTMGPGMIANIDLTIWADAKEAAIAAHNMAEMDAERNRIQDAMDAETFDNDNDEEG